MKQAIRIREKIRAVSDEFLINVTDGMAAVSSSRGGRRYSLTFDGKSINFFAIASLEVQRIGL
ncbi:MAG: hypothetical protein HY274_00965 [Gammaproteobacteria bacterium]|nr:hypothetical protein [Gammaproteobacteria bacterium]